MTYLLRPKTICHVNWQTLHQSDVRRFFFAFLRPPVFCSLLFIAPTKGPVFNVAATMIDKKRMSQTTSRRFFSLPMDVKRKIPAKQGGFTRGYIGFGGESGSHRLECKEAFSYGWVTACAIKLYAAHVVILAASDAPSLLLNTLQDATPLKEILFSMRFSAEHN